MAIAYDFPFNLLESEIGASTNAEDIYYNGNKSYRYLYDWIPLVLFDKN